MRARLASAVMESRAWISMTALGTHVAPATAPTLERQRTIVRAIAGIYLLRVRVRRFNRALARRTTVTTMLFAITKGQVSTVALAALVIAVMVEPASTPMAVLDLRASRTSSATTCRQTAPGIRAIRARLASAVMASRAWISMTALGIRARPTATAPTLEQTRTHVHVPMATCLLRVRVRRFGRASWMRMTVR